MSCYVFKLREYYIIQPLSLIKNTKYSSLIRAKQYECEALLWIVSLWRHGLAQTTCAGGLTTWDTEEHYAFALEWWVCYEEVSYVLEQECVTSWESGNTTFGVKPYYSFRYSLQESKQKNIYTHKYS